ncbi:MAG: DsbA family protein [Actinomycetota bacterium]
MNIEVFADIWCPFTHVGLRAVAEQRQAAGRPDLGIVVRSWPLELVNGEPMDARKAQHHADDLREQVAPGLFADLDLDHFPTSTIDALALVVRAYRAGITLGERASFALRDALFEHGKDISDANVLQQIADDLGVGMPDDLDRDAVRADWDEGTARGVLGSPHFFCGDVSVFCPSLTITRDESGLTITADRTRFDAFLRECLATK